MLITQLHNQAGSHAYNKVLILCHPKWFCLLCLGKFPPPSTHTQNLNGPGTPSPEMRGCLMNPRSDT